jgi:hypothetical protein
VSSDIIGFIIENLPITAAGLGYTEKICPAIASDHGHFYATVRGRAQGHIRAIRTRKYSSPR